jgi:hypothetical protein
MQTTISYDSLIAQEAELNRQLKAVRDYISAFYPNKNVEDAIQTPILEKSAPLSSVYKTIKRRTGVKKGVKGKPKETVPDKVKKGLSLIEIGKTKDIANKMIEVYPEYGKNPDKAIKDARLYISGLVKKNEVEVIEEGLGNSGNTYKIKVA